MSPNRRARMERAIKLHEKTIASHESGQELTRRIIEEHAESTSQKFMKFNSNPTEDQIEKHVMMGRRGLASSETDAEEKAG